MRIFASLLTILLLAGLGAIFYSYSAKNPKVVKVGIIHSLIGHYASWSYFEEIDSDENRKFPKLMKKSGIQNPTDPMEAAYSAVMLYKQAVEEAGSFEPSSVKRALVHQSYKVMPSLRQYL